MNKREIIGALESLREGSLSQKERVFAKSLAKCAEELDDFSELDKSQLVLLALDALDKDERDSVTGLEGGPRPIEILQMVDNVLKAIGEDCYGEIKTYCNASLIVLRQKISAFLQQTYHSGIFDFSRKDEWKIKFRYDDDDMQLHVFKRRNTSATHFKFERADKTVLHFLSERYYNYDLYVIEANEDLCDCIAMINAITEELT